MPNTAPFDAAAETLETPPIALDRTVASTHGVPAFEAAPRAASSNSSTSMRTTVLPRIEMVDATPRLVVEGKRRFEPTRRLGEGGQGEVTGAQDHDIGRTVAIKRLRVEARSPDAELRFAEEVRTVGQLEHPNIVPIHDVGMDENGDYYFVMKYVEGETLEAIIEKLAAGDRDAHARYGIERRVQIFIAILEAVAYAHAKDILHRDIKPANIMVGAYGEVALMDWGIAKRGGQAPIFDGRPGEIVGTPAYMSPEQARGEAVDERSDVYALSLLFHELLCLAHPLAAKASVAALLHAVVYEPVPHTSFVVSAHQPPVPAELGWFVRKGLEKDRAKRFQSVREMLDRLERRAEGSFPIQCPMTFATRTLGILRRFVDRHPVASATLLGAAIVLSIVAAAALAWRALF